MDVLMAARTTWGVPIALPLGFEPGWSADGTAARGPSSAVARADDGRHGVGSHAGSGSWARWGAGRVACVVGTMWAEAWRPRRVLLPARCLLGPAASTATVAPTALPRRVLRAVARSMCAWQQRTGVCAAWLLGWSRDPGRRSQGGWARLTGGDVAQAGRDGSVRVEAGCEAGVAGCSRAALL